jgi:hypothetical protein
MRKILFFLLCIGILISWQICQSDIASAWDKRQNCSLAGVWIGVNPDGGETIANYTPLDASGKRFSVIGEGLQAHLPGDTQASKIYGIAERIGLGMYEATFYQYGVSPTMGKVWKVIVYETFERVDCDHYEVEATINLFFFDEDGNEVPSGCFPGSGTVERLTLEPPCQVTQE